jgi:hypothetical protein
MIGALTEQLTVTASAPMVETKTTGVGQVIDNQRVRSCRSTAVRPPS